MRKIIILLIATLLSAGAYATDTSSDNTPLTKKEQRRTLRGYKGFVELGSIMDHATVFGWEDQRGHHFDLLTSHGYQFNNFFYLGGGTGVLAYPQYGVLMPLFGNIRINVLNNRISPVIDLKGGYSVGRFYGGFWSIDIGVRVKLKGKKAMYATIGTMFQNDANPTVNWIDIGPSGYSNYLDDWSNAGFGIRFGYEF